MVSAGQRTCLVLLQCVGDGGASQGGQCCRRGSSVAGKSAQKHLVNAFRRLALFSHQNCAFLKWTGYVYTIFDLILKEKEVLK